MNLFLTTVTMKTSDYSHQFGLCRSYRAAALLSFLFAGLLAVTTLNAQKKQYFKPVLDKSAEAAAGVGKGGEGQELGPDGKPLTEEEQRMKDRDGDGFADELTDEEAAALADSGEALLSESEESKMSLTEMWDEQDRRFFEKYPEREGKLFPANTPELRREREQMFRDIVQETDPWGEQKRARLADLRLKEQRDAELSDSTSSPGNENSAGLPSDSMNSNGGAKEGLGLKEQRDAEMSDSAPSPGNESGTADKPTELANNTSGQQGSEGFPSDSVKQDGGAQEGLGLKEQRDAEMSDSTSSPGNESGTADKPTELANNTSGQQGSEGFPSDNVKQDGGAQEGLGLKEQRDAEMSDSTSSPGNESGTADKPNELANNTSGQQGSEGFPSDNVKQDGGVQEGLGLKEQRDAQMSDSGSLVGNNSTSPTPQGTSNSPMDQGGGQFATPSAPGVDTKPSGSDGATNGNAPAANGEMLTQRNTNPSDNNFIPMESPQPGQQSGMAANDVLSTDIPGLPGNDAETPSNYVEKTVKQEEDDYYQAILAKEKQKTAKEGDIKKVEKRADKYAQAESKIRGTEEFIRKEGETGVSNTAIMGNIEGGLQVASGTGKLARVVLGKKGEVLDVIDKAVNEDIPLDSATGLAKINVPNGVTQAVGEAGQIAVSIEELQSKRRSGQKIQVDDVTKIVGNTLNAAGMDSIVNIVDGVDTIETGVETLKQTSENKKKIENLASNMSQHSQKLVSEMAEKKRRAQEDLKHLRTPKEKIDKTIVNAESNPKLSGFRDSPEFKERLKRDLAEYQERNSRGNAESMPTTQPGDTPTQTGNPTSLVGNTTSSQNVQNSPEVPRNQGAGPPTAPMTQQGDTLAANPNPTALADNTTFPENSRGPSAVPGNQSGGASAVPMTQPGDTPEASGNLTTSAGNTTSPQNVQNSPAVPRNQSAGPPAAPTTQPGDTPTQTGNPTSLVGNTTSPQNVQNSPAVPGNQSGGASAVPMTQQGDTPEASGNLTTSAGNTTSPQNVQNSPAVPRNQSAGPSAAPTTQPGAPAVVSPARCRRFSMTS